jgi:hypothetical protein
MISRPAWLHGEILSQTKRMEHWGAEPILEETWRLVPPVVSEKGR